MKQLINAYFIGGGKGVGKSTLIKGVSNYCSLKIIHAGIYFKDYNQNNSIKTHLDCIHDMINDLSEIKEDFILDTHYTHKTKEINGNYETGFRRGLEKLHLYKMNDILNINYALIHLDAKTLQNRRGFDSKRNRDCDIESIRQELNHEKKYFEKYTSENNKVGKIIENYKLDESIEELIDFINYSVVIN